MNPTFTLSCPQDLSKRTVRSDIEHSQAKARIAQQRILSSSYAEVRCVRCEVRDGVLYLRGQVTSFYLKQMSQETIRSIEGIDAIYNCVQVNYTDG
jgi:osmotically-inducible protein OsmY